MVASKALKAGEEILTESPFVVGPKYSTYAQCLSCYTPWPITDEKTLCSKCSWPVCDVNCENNLQHSEYECKVLLKK